MNIIKPIKDIVIRRHHYHFPIKNHSLFSTIKLYKRFIKEYRQFNIAAKIENQAAAPLDRLYPILNERTNVQNSVQGHYLYQPLWLMKLLKKSMSPNHLDIGSQTNMLGYIALEKQLTYIDIRDPELEIANFQYIQGSVTDLPLETGSIRSVSSLHVIEHIGLGRYGDPIDPSGHIRALEEISRIVAPGGDLYLSLPCGIERVEFNAHRVFHPNTIFELLKDFKLINLSGMTEGNSYHDQLRVEQLEVCNFGCGFFHFRKLDK